MDPLGRFQPDEVKVVGVLFGVSAAASVCGDQRRMSSSGNWIDLKDLQECLRVLRWAMRVPTASTLRAGF